METPEGITFGRPGNFPARTFAFVRRWPVVPVSMLGVLTAFAVFSPWIAPHDPLDSLLMRRNIPPVWYSEGSVSYILGADPLGRDILSRIIFGARVSLTIAAASMAAGLFIGATLGLIAGYAGGIVDEILMRFVDMALAVPTIMIALVVVAVAGQSFVIILLVLVLFSWTGFTRLVRAEVLTLKALDYVALAKVAGASPFRILYRHILPGVVSTITVVATLQVGGLILAESILSFLGAGIPPPTPSWGSMVSDGRDYLTDAWWVAFFPGVAILLTVLALNFLGDWLRDWFDPRLRQI